MPIVEADIEYRLTVDTGPGDANAQPDPDASLGGFVSTTVLAETLHALFDAITGDENAASDVEYRCIGVHNAHATLTLTAPVLWIASETAGGASLALAVDGTPASAIDSASAQAEQVADESTAPTGPSFSAPTSKGTGLALGDIGPGEVRCVWLRRSAADTGPLANDGASIRVEGDTL